MSDSVMIHESNLSAEEKFARIDVSLRLSMEEKVAKIEASLTAGCPINMDLILEAILSGSAEIVQRILGKVSAFSDSACRELIYPLNLSSDDICYSVIKHYTRDQINLRNYEGTTLLHSSFYTVKVERIKRLLELGGGLDPTYRVEGCPLIDLPDGDGSGRTPLFLAVMIGNKELVEFLVRHGSQAINSPDDDGWTPLELSADLGQKGVTRLLKVLGATWHQSLELPHLFAHFNARAEARAADSLLEEPLEIVRDRAIELILEPIDEEYSLSVRNRVYFSRSLLDRLIGQL